MHELARADLPPGLGQTVEKLFYEVHADMLGRCAWVMFNTTPLMDSHQDLRIWCEALILALPAYDHRYVGTVEGQPVAAVDAAFPLLVEAIRLVHPDKADQLPPVWDRAEWHRQLCRLQWSRLPEPQPVLGEPEFLSLTASMWARMRDLGGTRRPPEPCRVPDERAARYILDEVMLWCEAQQAPGPNAQQTASAQAAEAGRAGVESPQTDVPDPAAFRPAHEFLDAVRFKTFKAIRRALQRNPWIRSRKPSKQRLEIHAGDWMSFRSASNSFEALDDDAETVATYLAEVESRKQEIRAQNAKGGK
jgi:hypothetical protein